MFTRQLSTSNSCHTQGDVMTPAPAADNISPRLSRMTLALLQDSGW